MHITLLFLGEVSEEKIERLIKKTEKLNFKSFEVKIKNTGAFPSEKKPQVFWAGVESSEIKNLNVEIKKMAEEAGIETEDREFQPHLTLGRIREKCNLEKLIEENKKEFGGFKVDEILLKKSVLTSEGFEHKTIGKIYLTG